MRSMTTTAVALAALALLGCGEQDGPAGQDAPGGKTLTIGMMPKLIGIPYFNACEKGAREAAAELGVEVVYHGPIQADVNKQAELLDTWIIRRLDAVTVAPNDPHALAPTLQKAMKKDIAVLTFDADSDEDSRQYFVNQATYEAIGHALVDTMAEQIGGDGPVAIITGTLTAANQNKWMEKMRERIAEKYPEMDIVTVKAPGEDQQKAYQVTQDVLKAHPDLEGIFGITSVALPGAAKAVKDAGKTGTVAVTGLSTPNIMRQFVKDGVVETVILWNPVDLGYLTLYAAKRVIEEGELPEEFEAGRLGTVKVVGDEVLLGPPLRFTRENIDQFDF